MEYMAEEAMPIRRNMSGWHLPVMDRTEPRYVNSVTPSTECPLTYKLDVLESLESILSSARTHVNQVLTLFFSKITRAV